MTMEYNSRKSQREYQKREYLRRKKQGLCVRCGKNKAIEGKTRCEKCREKENENNKLDYYFAKSLNLCPKCGKIPEIGHIYCKECMEYKRKYNMRKYQKNSDLGK